MKKFYSLVAVAALSLSVNAQDNTEVLNQDFNMYTNEGGNDGNWSGSFNLPGIPDGYDEVTGFTYTKAYAGNGSVKLGTGSAQGIATTPKLVNIEQNAILTFRAGAWNGNNEKTTLLLEITGGGTLSVNQVELTKGEFTEYTVNISGATSESQITFKGFQPANSRFFLDDVVVQNVLAIADYGQAAKAIQNTVWTNTAAFSTKANASVEVYNVNGQLVKSFEVNGNKNVNVSDLAAGVYVVKSTENGKTTTTKVVKK